MTAHLYQLRQRGQSVDVGHITSADRHRLVHAKWGRHGIIIKGTDGKREAYVISSDTVDLGFIEARQAPLLWQHKLHFDDHLGILETAWIEDGTVNIIARLGHSPKAEIVWRNLCDGIVYGCSAHAVSTVTTEEDIDGEEVTFHRRWTITELSLSFPGYCWDRNAIASTNAGGYDALVARKDAAAAARRQALEDAMAEPWRRWAEHEAGEIARAIGYLDTDKLRAELVERVERRARDWRSA